jgi:SAM-dependent methyltransferase
MTTATLLATPPESFETIYAEARGDRSAIPWDDGRPSPALVNWLNAVAPSVVRCGARVAVVGCGLGDDARELMRRGYDVTAFDCSGTAVEWARRLDPANASSYVQANLFEPPVRWRHRFDLVIEIATIQALHPELRLGAVSAIADLLSPRGHLLVICRGAEEPVDVECGPPWALTVRELEEATALAGLAPDGPISSFEDDGTPPVMRIRAIFRRA